MTVVPQRVDVSVIIPTYNRCELLERALASVAAQTASPREVIVVDDGSDDGSQDMVRRSSAATRYIWQPNRGVSAARNLGIRETGGTWIAFLDSDDEWLPGKLARQLESLLQTPELLICHTDEIWIRNGRRVNPRRIHRKYGGRIFRHCLPRCVISPSSVLIHRTVLAAVGDFDENLPACEDYDLWLRVCARYPVLFLAEQLIVKYGGSSDQLSRGWGLDRYRIAALEKILRRGHLEPADQRAAERMLLAKIDIYLNGARKRCKQAEVRALEARRRQLRGTER